MGGRRRVRGVRNSRLPHPQTADVFVAVTGDDEDNLVASLLAKQEFGVPRVLARVNHPANEWLFTDDWGVDHAVSAPHLLSGLVQEAVTVGSVVRLLELAENARLVEVTLTVDAPRRRVADRAAPVPSGSIGRGDPAVPCCRRSTW